jgi:hypothetical protein
MISIADQLFSYQYSRPAFLIGILTSFSDQYSLASFFLISIPDQLFLISFF